VHGYECSFQDFDATFVQFTKCNFPKMKHHLRGRRAVLEGDVHHLVRQEFSSDTLKSAVLDRHIVHVLKIVLTREEDVCLHASDGAVAHEMRGNQFTEY